MPEKQAPVTPPTVVGMAVVHNLLAQPVEIAVTDATGKLIALTIPAHGRSASVSMDSLGALTHQHAARGHVRIVPV